MKLVWYDDNCPSIRICIKDRAHAGERPPNVHVSVPAMEHNPMNLRGLSQNSGNPTGSRPNRRQRRDGTLRPL